MLIQLSSREDLEQVVRETKKFVETMYFHFSIDCFLDGGFPESPVRVFAYPSTGPRKYYFMIKDNLHIKPYCLLARPPHVHFDRTEFMDCLREFRVRALGALNSNREHLMIGEEELVKGYTDLMRNIVCDVKDHVLPLYFFYMNPTQRQEMMQQKQRPLPNGYQFDDIDPINEGHLINSTWKHAGDGDLEQTIAKLVRLPSACVKMDGQPVAFEMVDPAGFFNNQYVFEEHRRKGLGTAVETALAKKCIENGMVPFKTVDKKNKVALEASQQSRFWTQWTRSVNASDTEHPVTVIFQEWTRQ